MICSRFLGGPMASRSAFSMHLAKDSSRSLGSWWLLTTGGEGVLKGGGEGLKIKDRLPTLVGFPWRAAPPKKFRLLGFVDFFLQSMALSEIIGKSFKQPNAGPEYLDKEFGEGVIGAFPQIVKGIFGPTAIMPLEPKNQEASNTSTDDTRIKSTQASSPLDTLSLSTTKDCQPSDSGTLKEPVLEDYFHPSLVDLFYQGLAAAEKADQQVIYNLLRMKLIEPCDIHTVLGSSRIRISQEPAQKVFKKDFFGFTVVGPEKKSGTGPGPGDRKQQPDYVTVQVDVDVHCQEIFMVKDKISGAILQGGNEISDVMHRLKFEAVFLPNDEWKMQEDWLVVDIDNWLEGNKFI